jgi:hypothetical protein
MKTPDTVTHTPLRESIIHGLRMRGWSKIDAENEADYRIARQGFAATTALAKAKAGS